MQRKKLYLMLATAGALGIVVAAIALALPQPASAQCGSQASSCKNCHEVQGKDPVNTDGTSWHQAHAFGDFCYICHGGNSQASDEVAAHMGEVDPMNDVQAACASCHPNDLEARVSMYAKVLNVPVNLGAGAGAPAATPAAAATSAPGAAPAPVAAQPAGVDASVPAGSGQLVDYVQRYDQQVLNKYPVNWGNVILWIMLIGMVLGGGALVLIREKLVRVSFQETKSVEGEYPADVVDLVPELAKLKPASRKTLGKLIKRPDASKLLDAVETLRGENKEDKAE